MPTAEELEQMEHDYAEMDAQKVLKPDVREWLKGQCNRLMYGQCSTVRCLKRGGYVPPPEGSTYPTNNYDKLLALATCEAYEIDRALEQVMGDFQ